MADNASPGLRLTSVNHYGKGCLTCPVISVWPCNNNRRSEFTGEVEMRRLTRGFVHISISAFLATSALCASAETQKTLGATRPVDEAREPDDRRTKTLGTTRPSKRAVAQPAPPPPANSITVVPVINSRGRPPAPAVVLPPLIIPAEE